MTRALKVSYKAPKQARPAGIPAPRLQLRWESAGDGTYDRICHYEMVFPIREHDCRNDPRTGFCVIQLGRTMVGGREPNWALNLGACTPFRDGAHAQWDSAILGDLPVYVIAPDGTYAPLTITPPLNAVP